MMVVEQNGGKLRRRSRSDHQGRQPVEARGRSQLVDKLIEKDKVPIITGITFSNVMMAVHKKITEKRYS
jgi:branched-chain amino acid transport system substrate-binding protein